MEVREGSPAEHRQLVPTQVPETRQARHRAAEVSEFSPDQQARPGRSGGFVFPKADAKGTGVNQSGEMFTPTSVFLMVRQPRLMGPD